MTSIGMCMCLYVSKHVMNQLIKNKSNTEKLSIQGIRSFGVNEKQTIAFLKPLTIILGQNGSGKTVMYKFIVCSFLQQ